MDSTLKTILATKNCNELDARTLAKIVTYLIEHEVAVGGPYVFTGLVDAKAANEHIRNVFHITPKVSLKSAPKVTPTKLTDTTTPSLYDRALAEISNRASADNKKAAKTVLAKIQTADTGEVSRLSRSFYESLRPMCAPSLADTSYALDHLALGNIITWCGYSLLDPILDEPSGIKLQRRLSTLPLIFHCQRLALLHYSEVAKDSPLLLRLFNMVDNANDKEKKLSQCISIDISSDTLTLHYLPKITPLVNIMSAKSIAHTLGPLLLLRSAETETQRQALAAMQKYCAARQYQDDLHDWMDDLRNGQITHVIVRLLREAEVMPGTYSMQYIIWLLQSTYWQTTLSVACDEIEALINQSIALLEGSILVQDSLFSRHTLVPLSLSARKAKNSHEYNKAFLAAFHQ